MLGLRRDRAHIAEPRGPFSLPGRSISVERFFSRAV
jgi:hypothetical protein